MAGTTTTKNIIQIVKDEKNPNGPGFLATK